MKLVQVLVAFAASVSSASARQVVFQEGFETGLSNWTATGLWNSEATTDTCGSQSAPFPEGTQAAWYGHLTFGCNFETGGQANSGILEMISPIQLPSAASISLNFWMSSETEYCYEDGVNPWQYDNYSVYVLGQGGSFASVLLCPLHSSPGWQYLPWHERRMDLSAFSGQSVRVGFYFDTVDYQFNNGRGWFVDDVRILAEPGTRVCPGDGFLSGCPCVPWYLMVAGGCTNSTNQSAVMHSSGSVSVSADTLQFRVDHMPLNASALLSQATASTAPTVFGDGIRCVAGQVIRLGIVQASGGVATWPPPGTLPISQRGAVPASGGTRFYSVFYRDVVAYCSADAFNMTDTQRIQWVP